MLEQDRAILVRMVVLAAVVVALFFGYAAFRRAFLPPPDERVHVDAHRVAHMQALLRAIRPAAAAPDGSAGEAVSCSGGNPGAREQTRQDVEELNLRLAKLSAGTAPFLPRLHQLDAQAWLAGAAALPGGCERAAETLDALLWVNRGKRRERAYLTRLEWRDRVGKARWKWGDEVHVAVRQERFAQANPWRSLLGCVLVADRGEGGSPAAVTRVVQGGGSGWGTACPELAARDERGKAAALDAASRAVPRDLALLAGDLDAWRDPESRIYQTLVGESNSVSLRGGATKAVGLHVLFTFDPALQRIAQTVAECYAGDGGGCGALGIPDPGNGMMEGARVRQVGIAVIDIASGEVLAAASAESRCFRHDLSGVGPRPPDCPDFGAAAREHYRGDADALLNHALFTVAPPGSTVKPIIAAGFLQDPGYARTDAELTDRIKRSDSRIFLDWMFCRAGEGRGAFAPRCQRPARIQSAAHALGWNTGCGDGADCGRLDILFGRPSHVSPAGFPTADRVSGARFSPSSRHVLLGRMLVTLRDQRLQDMSPGELQPDPARLGGCASAKWDGGAQACRKPGLGAVSEGYGQGSAGATPAGVAGMMAQLAASAQRGGAVRYPHVVRNLLNSKGQADPAGDPGRWGIATRPPGIEADRAQRILAALEHTHRSGGTAGGGCKKVFGQDCGDIGVAGKTGTTSFGAEFVRLAGFQKGWREYETARQNYRTCASSARGNPRGCRLPEVPPRPWRWYAGVFKNDPAGAHFDRAFAVLVERNWTTAGRIDQLGGEGSNSAAIEIGFHLIRAARKTGGNPQEPG